MHLYVILILTWITPVVFAEVKHDVYVYSDPFDPKSSYVLDTKKRTIVEGDLSFELKICNNDSPLLCFSSKSLSFAVPKDRSINTWSNDGLSYEITGSWKSVFQGMDINIERISTMYKDVTIVFLYSYTRGLIGISFSNNKTERKFYMLQGAKGFGAGTK